MPVRSLIFAAGLLLSATLAVRAADPPVSLELVTEPGFPIDGHARWTRLLQDRELDIRVRIRSARLSDEPKIENRGSESSPRYTVTGVLTADGKLILPGIILRHTQRRELVAWLEKLRKGGEEIITSPTLAFGLTAKQLRSLVEALRKPVAIPTKGKATRDVLAQIKGTLTIPVELDSSARSALAGDAKVLDELQGISCGTALVAAVRPLGLLVTPTGQGSRTVGIRITRNAKLTEAWPVGTAAKKGAQGVAPGLLKYITVTIDSQPLDDTLNVIQDRLEIPFLYDHNALARHGVDLHEPVSLPRNHWFYKKIIDQLLIQKLLSAQLRLDDAGSAFLWITSVKK